MEQDTTTTMPVMDSGKQKTGKGWKFATVIASVVAVCGIGFGVYGMIQSSQKDNQISNLKIQIEDSDGKIATLETDEIKISDDSQTITIDDSIIKKQNPIISATNSDEDEYIRVFTISNSFHIFDYNTGNSYSLNISLRDGDIASCGLYSVSGSSSTLKHGCDISGIAGKIYKIGYLAHGQMGNPPVVFVMQDGTVYYFELDDALETTEISVKQLNTGGFVTDIIDEIGVFVKRKGAAENEGGSGYVTSALVYSDGTYMSYESLFEEQ